MMEGQHSGADVPGIAGRAYSGSNDRFSTWSIVLIALVVGLQLFLNDGEALIQAVSPNHHSAPSDSIPTDAFDSLITVDNSVKMAYAGSLLPPSVTDLLTNPPGKRGKNEVAAAPTLSPFHTEIQSALTESIDALRAHPDGTYFARRVIILRMVMAQPPFGPIPASGKKRGLTSPLDAYRSSARENPLSAKYLLKEEDFWSGAFSGSTIPRSQLSLRLRELNDYPTLLFYCLIARQQIFLRAGSFAEAKRANSAMQRRSIYSLACLGATSLSVSLLFIVGVVIWIGCASLLVKPAALSGDQSLEAPKAIRGDAFARFLTPLPSRIVDGDRKLRAGHLLDCFAVYLVVLMGLGTVLELAIPRSSVQHLTAIQLIYANIGLSLISYVGASALAFVFLYDKSRRLGASLSQELGLSASLLLKNILYGAAGWGASLVLLVGVTLVTQRLFHSLPSPENPALPMLSFAPNTISRFALYGLAAIAAPFFEETFFRGVLLNALLLRFRPIWACLIVGVMFGGIHPVGVSEACSLSALGAVFAWMAYLRKSLAPSMFAHFMQNSFAYTSVYLCFSLIARR